MKGIALRTVLFTDLCRSTALFSALPRSQAERLRGRHLDVLSHEVRRHDGEEVQQLGDGVMAVFDSAASALACAVTMQRAVAEEARRERVRLEMRVGLSTGDAARAPGDWFGEPVVRARRLCDTAPPRAVLADVATASAARTRHEHTFQSMRRLELKGLPEPVDAVVVDWRPPERRALRVALADDAVLVREGLARLLADDGMDVVGQAQEADQLIALVHDQAPDVVVSDIRMPALSGLDGVDAAILIRERYPGTGVLLLSQHLDRRAALRLMGSQGGGVGYLLKERALGVGDFAAAVRRVACGGVAVDGDIVVPLVERLAAGARFTGAHRVALGLVAQGHPEPVLAERLGLPVEAVGPLVSDVLSRLGVDPATPPPERATALLRLVAG